MTNPRVSVVIPFFNAARFLQETVESVLAQTFPDWELLLADDGSSDQSTQMALAYAESQPGRIRYIEHDGHVNRGLTATRNLGVHHARAAILAFLDADDLWLPEKLEVQVAELDAHPEAGFLFAPTLYWYEWDSTGNRGQRDWIPPLAPGSRVYEPSSLFLASYPFGPWGSPCPCSFLARRKTLDAVGGFEECFHNGTFQLYEDIAFMAKLYLQVPIYVSSACLDRNRCSPHSMTRQAENMRKEEAARRYYFQWLRGYLRRQAVHDPAIWRAVRRESWFYALPLPAAKLVRRVGNKARRVMQRLAG
ncbi:MAG TPA: glycosyltransferase family 2 protein [Terracidiphilus sp.]|nr:glycosyltransferase family 2 protein [Terracidiphilus sp.]